MHDPRSFETRLQDAFDRYVAAGAPTDVDGRAVAAAVASGADPTALRLPFARRGVLRLGLLAALVALLAVALAVAGSRLVTPTPIGGGGRILVTYPTGPASLLTVSTSGTTVRPVAVQGCPIFAGDADAVVTRERFTGFRYRALAPGGTSSLPISTSYSGGERWAPGHQALALVNWTDSVVTFVRAGADPANPVRTTVPVDGTGIPTNPNGDFQFDGAFSADGSRFALRTDPDTDGHARLRILSVAEGTTRDLGAIPSTLDATYGTFAWTRDGSALAVVGTRDGAQQVAVVSTTSGELRWLGRPAETADDAAAIPATWAGDGTHLGVWFGDRLFVAEATTGTWTRTPLVGEWSSTEAVLSSDGARVATITGSSVTLLTVADGSMTTRALGGEASAWNPDRTAIASLLTAPGGASATVRVLDPWSAADPVTIATVPASDIAAAPVLDGVPCIQWAPAVQP